MERVMRHATGDFKEEFVDVEGTGTFTLTIKQKKDKLGYNDESIYKVVNSRLGWYKRCSMDVVNFILNPTLLETKIKYGAGALNPLNYYLRNVGI